MIENEILDSFTEGLVKKGPKSTEEIEVSFLDSYNRLPSGQQFRGILNLATELSKKSELKTSQGVDIQYTKLKQNEKDDSVVDEITMRINLPWETVEHVRENIGRLRNHEIVKYILESTKLSYHIEIKTKVIKYDMFQCRVRFSQEIPVKKDMLKSIIKDISPQDDAQIIFRLKERISVPFPGKEFLLDTTIVRQSNIFRNLTTALEQYEIEVEILKGVTPKKFYDMRDHVLCYMNNQDHIVSLKEKALILNQYKSLFSISGNKKIQTLKLMPVVSMQLSDVEKITENVSLVTDKANGLRGLLTIVEGQAYFVNSNLKINPIKGFDSKLLNKWNESIVDVEYIYSEKHQCHLYMTFDMLFVKGVDKRQSSLMGRREYLATFVKECFGYDYKLKEAGKKEQTVKGIFKFHEKEFLKHVDNLNKAVKSNKRNVIAIKHFIKPVGVSLSEIYMCMEIIWKNKNVFPYSLDGIIESGNIQENTESVRKIIHPNKKWKPPDENSIDFMIEFVKDGETKMPIEMFDNSEESKMNSPYRIVKLMVGRKVYHGEMPVEFLPEEDWNRAYIPIQEDGSVRDINGHIIQDKTVVEFAMNYVRTDCAEEKAKCWIPLETRWDKTTSVKRFRKKYGNNENIAKNILNTITNPLTFEMIQRLSDPTKYSNAIDDINTKLHINKDDGDDEVDESKMDNDKDKAYYNIKTTEASEMRAYNSWVKETLIKNFSKKSWVLDWGVGQGGDVSKYIHAGINIIGIDPDANGLYSAEGAISRYKNMKKKLKSEVEMEFIHINPSILFENQDNMGTEDNQLLIKNQLLERKDKFDGMAAMYSFHYNFESTETLNNAINNMKSRLASGAKVVIICFDGKELHSKLKKAKGTLKLDYVSVSDKVINLFSIKKTYSEKVYSKIQTGAAIDVHNSIFMEEGAVETEYIVPPKLLTSTMKKAGFKIVETDMIDSLYDQKYFEDKFAKETVSSLKTRYSKILSYGTSDTSEMKACKAWNALFRYYIFEKK
tara:strand:- start:1697 stop:4705 length:3009 start_codon:yes stop_codon:yes gene_type:complete